MSRPALIERYWREGTPQAVALSIARELGIDQLEWAQWLRLGVPWERLEEWGRRAPPKKATKKRPAKKVAKKHPAKKVAKKRPAKKVTKKRPAKKVTKKRPAKKVTKKRPAKKVTKKRPAKKVEELRSATRLRVAADVFHELKTAAADRLAQYSRNGTYNNPRGNAKRMSFEQLQFCIDATDDDLEDLARDDSQIYVDDNGNEHNPFWYHE